MGLTNSDLKNFIRRQDYLKVSWPGARSLAIGSVDFRVDYETLKQCAIDTISESDYREYRRSLPDSGLFYQSSKKMMAKIFHHFGYASYEELDINKRADIKLDLNYPLTQELKEKYDLIWDAGSLEHIMNINQALENAVAMLKVGGRMLHTQGIGDQTNAGYWTISPNFYIDFYRANGFKLDLIQLFDRCGRVLDYSEVIGKGSTVGELLPLRLSIIYYLKTIRYDLNSKITRSFTFLSRVLNYFIRIPLIGCLGEIFFSTKSEKKPDWMVMVIATKLKSSERMVYPIQNIYRAGKSI